MPPTLPPNEDWPGDTGHGFWGEPDADTFRPPPHPDDRLWRHPSEAKGPVHRPRPKQSGEEPLDASGGSRLRPRRKGRRARSWHREAPRVSWPRILLATATGAAMAAGALTALGMQGGRVVDAPRAEDVAVAPAASSPSEPPESLAGLPATGEGEVEALHSGAWAETASSTIEPATVLVEGPGGQGSGLLLRDDGVVLTSAALVHAVLASGEEPTVPITLAGGHQASGEVLGSDVLTDVAVLRLPEQEPPGRHYPTAALSERARARTGANVMLVGRRGDGAADLTGGVVASSNWSLPGADRDRPLRRGLLQIGLRSEEPEGTQDTEEPTPPGPASAGGPVVNEDGDVVGMTTSSSQGWAYAVPIDIAAKVVEDILETGTARHAWLGIRGRDARGPSAGVVVTEATRTGPAAGRLGSEDVIVATNGTPVPSMAALQATLLLYKPGDRIVITYHEAGEGRPRKVELTLAERPANLP